MLPIVAIAARSRGSVRVARVMWLAGLSLAALFGALVLSLSLVPSDSTVADKDFGQEYILARAILDHVDPYQPVQELAARYVTVTGNFVKAHPTPHPPTVGLLALPLGLLSYPVAARVWFGFELGCLLTALALLGRGANVPLRPGSVALLALALVGWPPMTLELGLGQLMLPLLLGLAAAQLALIRGRSGLGGGLLGLTLLIKPIAWPWLLVLAWRRDARALLSVAGVVVVGAGLSVAAIGLERCLYYVFGVLPSITTGFLPEATNMSLWTVAPRLGSPVLSGLLPAVGLVAATWWSCRRQPLGISLAMLTVASLLISPIMWYFYLVLALLPLGHVLALVIERGFRLGEVCAAAGVLALTSVSQAQLIELIHGGAATALLLEPALALLLLAALLVWLSRDSPSYLTRGRGTG
jgi:alpha-1,2-mannosyltransferase